MFRKQSKNPGTITVSGLIYGASDLTRTGDLLITSEMHYRLCYTSIGQDLNIIAESGKKVKHQSLRIPNSRSFSRRESRSSKVSGRLYTSRSSAEG